MQDDFEPVCNQSVREVSDRGKVKNRTLHNKYDKESLRQRLASEKEPRVTISFYRYARLKELPSYRAELYKEWEDLGVLGRIYIAAEGINAQVSVPGTNLEGFKTSVERRFPGTPLKYAVEQGSSFLKLQIKVKQKILADGLDDGSYDVTNVGKHLTASEWNEAMEKQGTIVVDVRNHYEHEVGRFQNALLPDADTFSSELPMIKEMLTGKEEQKILLYCTGGIRCEKTSAWLKHEGFQDVNQLHGGIIDYKRQIDEQKLENKFIGKNFVFDERLGERISEDIIARCHTCGKPCDDHLNCAWEACHILYIQCSDCREALDSCCSAECQSNTQLPDDEKKLLIKTSPRMKSRYKRPDKEREIRKQSISSAAKSVSDDLIL